MKLGYGFKHPLELESELDGQMLRLKQFGCEALRDDEGSDNAGRHGLEETIAKAKAGDVLVVDTIDRFARTGSELLRLLNQLQTKGIDLEVLDFGGDRLSKITTNPSVVRQITLAIFNFEHATQLRRQRNGISKAKDQKKYLGRHPSARLQREEIWTRFVQNRQSASTVAQELKVSVPSVYRIVREVEAERREKKVSDFAEKALNAFDDEKTKEVRRYLKEGQ